mmetsp:Transcript_17456/g.37723  ORF Transcript_17456/g.37723 Transcript_17456/m.37723 type:complete len:200 (-) Transcript_17456:686-1285(-)
MRLRGITPTGCCPALLVTRATSCISTYSAARLSPPRAPAMRLRALLRSSWMAGGLRGLGNAGASCGLRVSRMACSRSTWLVGGCAALICSSSRLPAACPHAPAAWPAPHAWHTAPVSAASITSSPWPAPSMCMAARWGARDSTPTTSTTSCSRGPSATLSYTYTITPRSLFLNHCCCCCCWAEGALLPVSALRACLALS